MVAALALVAGCSDDSPAPVVAGPADATVEDVTAATPPRDGGASDAALEGGVPGGPRDRAGRAFFSTLLVARENYEVINRSEAPIEVGYFTRAKGAKASVGEFMDARLARFDALDGVLDWPAPDAGAPSLADTLLVDALLVDPSRPAAAGYLEIEASGAAHVTSGGRHPSEDALDITLSWLVSRKRSGVGDGFDGGGKPITDTFPYLAEPHP
ncbi:MAG: hypothetical protein IPG50_03110 [Myxococcales bacterium]|nr:hypothetical protein [Myxococcales bacterium]